jgi:hypothetical protein
MTGKRASLPSRDRACRQSLSTTVDLRILPESVERLLCGRCCLPSGGGPLGQPGHELWVVHAGRTHAVLGLCFAGEGR